MVPEVPSVGAADEMLILVQSQRTIELLAFNEMSMSWN
jgi:hypothetical protein